MKKEMKIGVFLALVVGIAQADEGNWKIRQKGINDKLSELIQLKEKNRIKRIKEEEEKAKQSKNIEEAINETKSHLHGNVTKLSHDLSQVNQTTTETLTDHENKIVSLSQRADVIETYALYEADLANCADKDRQSSISKRLTDCLSSLNETTTTDKCLDGAANDAKECAKGNN